MSVQEDQYREELAKIENRIRGNYTFWMLPILQRQMDKGFLIERIESHSYPSLQPIAQELMNFITDHEQFIKKLSENTPVMVPVKYGELEKGTIGEYVEEVNPFECVLQIRIGKPDTTVKRIPTALLFPCPKQIEQVLSSQTETKESGVMQSKNNSNNNEVLSTLASSEVDKSETNPLHAGFGGGEDGSQFLSTQTEKKKRGRRPYTDEQRAEKARVKTKVVETSASIQLHKSTSSINQPVVHYLEKNGFGGGDDGEHIKQPKKIGRPLGSKNKTKNGKKDVAVSAKPRGRKPGGGRLMKPENFLWDIKRVEPERLQKQLDTLHNLLKTGDFWTMPVIQQNESIDGLVLLSKEGEKKVADLAKLLLLNIQRQLCVLDQLVPEVRVTLWKEAVKKPAGASGKIVLITSVLAHVLFDGDREAKVVSKYWLNPEKTQESVSKVEEPVVPPPTSNSETSVVNVEPNAVVDSDIIVGEPLVSEEDHDPDVTESVTDQPSFVPTEPIKDITDGSTVMESPVSEKPVDVIAAQRELMVVSQQLQDEHLPIKDKNAFVPGRIFAMQHGLVDPFYQLYYVLQAVDHPNERRVALECRLLDLNLLINEKLRLSFPYPKRWFTNEQQRFFYPTQQEYLQLSAQYPFGNFSKISPVQLGTVDTQYRQWLCQSLNQVMSDNPRWTKNPDFVFSMTEILKHYLTDRQIFPAFLQAVGSDCETEELADYVFEKILFFLKDEEGYELVREAIDQVAKETKTRLRIQASKERIREYATVLDNDLDDDGFTPATLAEIELIMQKVAARKEKKE